MERLPRPQRDRVLVQFGSDKETKTDSGIIVPATQTDDEIIRSTVLAVGRGAYSENGVLLKPEVKVGDEIMFQKGLEDEITIDGRTFLVILEAEIIVIL